MRHTTIYSMCPACKAVALVQPLLGTYRCAACNYDYKALAQDDSVREAWMLDNLRQGPMFAIFVKHLHRVLLELPIEESNERVQAFAARHGIELPAPGAWSSKRIVLIALGLVLSFIGLVVLIGLLAG